MEFSELDNLLFSAIGDVDQSYFSTLYDNIEAFKFAIRNHHGVIRGSDFERYGERIFCYELYHQLRVRIEQIKSENPDFLQGAMLQGEVNKMMIKELAVKFGLNPIKDKIIPDFLIHSPGNANAHICAIEVKSGAELKDGAFSRDLEKLNDLICSYEYQNGYFLSVNTEDDYISALLQKIKPNIQKLRGRGRIKVLNKKNQYSKLHIWQLK